MNVLDVYSNHISRLISGDKGVIKDSISATGLKLYSGLFATNKYVTKVWSVTSVPFDYNTNISTAIRTEMFEKHPDSKIVISMDVQNVNINIKNDLYKTSMNNAYDRYSEYANLFENMGESTKRTGLSVNVGGGRKVKIEESELIRRKELSDSYNYVHDQITDGNQMALVTYFVQASCLSKEKMDMFTGDLEALLSSLRLTYSCFNTGLNVYLEKGTPANPSHKNVFNSMLMSPENISCFIPKDTLGLLSSRGLPIGVDPRSGLPVLHDIYSSPTAQVSMIVGATGSGKTFLSQIIANAHLAKGTHGSMIDMKGGEGALLIAEIGGMEVDFGSPNSKYFNSLRIDDITGYDIIPELVYMDAVRMTVDILTIMSDLSVNEGNPSDLNMVLNKAVEKTYFNAHVYPNNKETFVYSKKLKLMDVIETLSELSNSSSFDEDVRSIIVKVIARCTEYLSPTGHYASAFKNEITLADIINTEFVVYNMNKARQQNISVLDSIKVYSATALDTKKANIRKTQGLQTFALYEELQKCVGMDTLIRSITDKVTLSRSEGLFIYLMFNAISVLTRPEFAQIRSNINTKIVGKLDPGDADLIIKYFDCGEIASEIRKINNTTSREYKKFRNAFAIYSDTGTGILKGMVKAVTPDELEKALRTRSYTVEE